MGNLFSPTKPPQTDIIETIETIQKERGVPMESEEMQKHFEDVYNRAFQSLLKQASNPCEYYNRNVYHCIRENAGRLTNCQHEVKLYEKCVHDYICKKLHEPDSNETPPLFPRGHDEEVGLTEVKAETKEAKAPSRTDNEQKPKQNLKQASEAGR